MHQTQRCVWRMCANLSLRLPPSITPKKKKNILEKGETIKKVSKFPPPKQKQKKITQRPFRTKNATALESVVFCPWCFATAVVFYNRYRFSAPSPWENKHLWALAIAFFNLHTEIYCPYRTQRIFSGYFWPCGLFLFCKVICRDPLKISLKTCIKLSFLRLFLPCKARITLQGKNNLRNDNFMHVFKDIFQITLQVIFILQGYLEKILENMHKIVISKVIFALQGYFCLARQKLKNNPRRCLGNSLSVIV